MLDRTQTRMMADVLDRRDVALFGDEWAVRDIHAGRGVETFNSAQLLELRLDASRVSSEDGQNEESDGSSDILAVDFELEGIVSRVKPMDKNSGRST